MTNKPTDDRDLDVEVAYMLGWRMCLGTGEDGASWMTMESPDGETMEARKGSHWNYRDFDTLPHYSTDHNLAFQVVEVMERRGYWCQMRTPFMEPGRQDGYWCGFTPHGTSGWNGTPDHWTSAPTLAEAICRAALKCVQEREP